MTTSPKRQWSGRPALPRNPDLETGGATDRVVRALREAIVTMEIPPGTALDKTELALRFGVSRFPLAEAFNRLKAEGLVEIRPQSGSRVTVVRLVDVRENMFLRRALEGETVAFLARQRDPAVLDELARNLRYQQAAVDAGDRPGFHRLDLEFHEVMTSAVGHQRIRSVVEQARLALDRARRLLMTPRRHSTSFREHSEILAAIEAGDPERARRAIAAHIDGVMEELEAFAGDHPELITE